MAKRLAAEADDLEKDVERPLFYPLQSPPYEVVGPSFSVSYGSRGRVLAIGDYELTPDQMQDIALGAFWTLFESQRDASEPGDPETFDRVFAEFESAARRRCHQRTKK